MKKKSNSVPLVSNPLQGIAAKPSSDLPVKDLPTTSGIGAQRLLDAAQIQQVEFAYQNAELRRERAELEDALVNFTDLYDFSPVAYFTITAESTIRQVNLTGANLTGIERCQLIGRSFQQLLGEPFQAKFQAFLQRVLTGGTGCSADFELTGQDTQTRVISITAQRLSNGKECRAMVADITSRQRTEKALRESEEFNRSVIESSPDCMKILDIAGNLLSILHGSQELLGIDDVRPFLHRPWTEFWQGEDVHAAETAIAAAAAGGEGNFVGFFRTFHNKAKWWDVRIVPILDAAGNPEKLLVVSRDVTQRKQTELNLAFLAAFSADLVRLTCANIIMQTIGAKIGAHFQLSLCAFAKIDEAANQVTIAHEWRRPDVPSLIGNHSLTDFVEEEFIRAARSGEMIVVRDTTTDPRTVLEKFAALKIASFVCMPLVIDQEWRYTFCLYHSEAHAWRHDEIDLIRELTLRLWTRLERLKITEALRKSEERYRTLLTSIDEGFSLVEMIFDECDRAIDYRFLEVNPMFEEQTGIRDAVGKMVSEVIPNLEAHWYDIYGKVALTGESIRFVNQANALENRWFDVYACRVGQPGSRKVAILFTNITERLLTERELAEKARLLDLSHDAIIVRDMEGHIRYWNHGATELYGWQHAEAMGQISHHLLKTEFPIPVEEMAAELHRTDRWIGELIHTKRNGQRATVLIRKTLDRDDAGKPIAVLENITDITKRKKAEEALHRSEALFSALVEQAPVGIYVVDAHLRLQQVNPTALPVFGDVQPLMGRDLAEIIQVVWPQQVAKHVMARIRHTLKTGQFYQSPPFSARRRDSGVKEDYEWQLQRMTLPDGEYGVVCFFNDITERKRAAAVQRNLDVLTASNAKLRDEIVRRQAVEKSLHVSEQEQRSLLKQSHQMQKRLQEMSRQILTVQEEERKRISRELHDVIAQALVGINVHVATIVQEATGIPASLRKKMIHARGLVEKSVDIVHQFARELRPTVLDDLGLIPALQALMKRYLQDTGIRASLKIGPAIEQCSITIRTALYRVVQEAFTNIARHAKASTAEVIIQCANQQISMEISDNGQGFNMDAATATKKHNRLGLLGMKERVEMVGGTFLIESALGQPTLIRVKIPYKLSL